MAKRNGFTREQHERLGLELKTMRERLGNIYCCIQRAYGVGRGRKILKTAKDAERVVDALRGLLSEAFWNDSGGRMDFGDPYYPHSYGKSKGMSKPLTYQEMDDEQTKKIREKFGIKI